MLKRNKHNSKKQRARRQREKRGATMVADHGEQLRRKPAERRRANIERREQRDDKILAKRNPIAFAARKKRREKWNPNLVKPVFE
jgi:hypothetical protein